MSAGMTESGLRRCLLWIPALVVVVCVGEASEFLLPNTNDVLTESYEPLKTLKFFHSRGRDVHKWGPMPSFVYGPVYAPFLATWYVSGEVRNVSSDYPYGLARPHEQIGLLIRSARVATSALGALAAVLLAYCLWRCSRSAFVTVVSVTVLFASAPLIVQSLACTKPDGLMLAFAAAALGVYAIVIVEGLAIGRGVLLSVLAVCSISCKELTALMFVLPYAGIAVDGVRRTRHDRFERRRFLRTFAVVVAAGLSAYALINVVYAPGSWLERVREVFGPLKDPAIWAPPGQTIGSYLGTFWRAVCASLGYGGGLLVAGAGVLTVLARPPRAGLLWLPFVSYALLVAATAGYIPEYFMAPLSLAACPAIASVYAWTARQTRLAATVWPRLVGAPVGLAVAVFSAFVGIGFERAVLASNVDLIVERYVTARLERASAILPWTLWPRNPGSTRLAYLGYTVDDRSLAALTERGGEAPEYVIVDAASEVWLSEFRSKPARAELWDQGMGYDYRRFPGVGALGYRLVAELAPELPSWFPPCLHPAARFLADVRVRVYRKEAEADDSTTLQVGPR